MRFYDGKKLVDIITQDENKADWSYDIWDAETAEYNKELDAYIVDDVNEEIAFANDWEFGTGEFASGDYDDWEFGENRKTIVKELEPTQTTPKVRYKTYKALINVMHMMFIEDDIYIVDSAGFGNYKSHFSIDTDGLYKVNTADATKHIKALSMAIEITDLLNSLNIEYYMDGKYSTNDIEFATACTHMAIALARRDADMLKRVLENGKL